MEIEVFYILTGKLHLIGNKTNYHYSHFIEKINKINKEIAIKIRPLLKREPIAGKAGLENQMVTDKDKTGLIKDISSEIRRK